MAQTTKVLTVCFLGLMLAASSLPGTAGAESDRTNRKLLQGGYSNRSNMPNLNANTVRAQAATSQAILEAVDNGGGVANTRAAGVVGSNMAWAAGQRDDVFNAMDRVNSPTTRWSGGKH